ncbi:fungal-specific transcription factor domain-containing protein [Pisolithus marmoratus]|nr:fungal-specific transcription factor domain-containing protein [Pisolithus marmoratus]
MIGCPIPSTLHFWCTACTFLGPSRKRGPPKGYIDAIEARLHQTEALLGILLALESDRSERGSSSSEHDDGAAKDVSLTNILAALRKDTLAREILNRVDLTPYGVRGRKAGKTKPRSNVHSQAGGPGSLNLQTTHPSTEWQDEVVSILSHTFHTRSSHPKSGPLKTLSSREGELNAAEGDLLRRRRRRLEGDTDDFNICPSGGSSTRSPLLSASPGSSPVLSRAGEASVVCSEADAGDVTEENVTDAFGQLSLNEDKQIRYHGEASGLHLLGINAKDEARNEDGIWRFPKARVWPPVPPPSRSTATDPPMNTASGDFGHLSLSSITEDSPDINLPDSSVQQHLLELYFTYVHASFPILHKGAFWDSYKSMQKKDSSSSDADSCKHNSRTSRSPLTRPQHHAPPLLLLSMFAIAARYSALSSPLPAARSSSGSTRPPEPPEMWVAGDNYFSQAKVLLDHSYASSRPSTVLALLLLGYRELGIGAMAQAWMYTGMAVRMAQDLGMHRSADGWARANIGKLFSDCELQERRRIWWGCVVLDAYISTYIGRPLAIVGKDYNTQLPSTDESEEMEPWATHTSVPPDINGHGYRSEVEVPIPATGHIISCFIASATLTTILSNILRSVYCIGTASYRQAESIRLESELDKWYHNLPEHLRFELRHDSSGNWHVSDGKSVPLPHTLTLHMQYWCTTLLLHRPFIHQVYMGNKKSGESSSDIEGRSSSEKNYELCVAAANHIASIVSFYGEKYCLQRAPMFLCFYVFSAGIMHITNLSLCPDDPQAQLGLSRCMQALEDMEIVWPSAARAHELLRTCNPLSGAPARPRPHYAASPSGQKRTADHLTETDGSQYDQPHSAHLPTLPRNANPVVPSQAPYAQAWRSTQYGTVTGGASATPSPDEFPQGAGQQSSFSPWNDAGGSGPYLPYPGALSTSVLSQTYSTGLVDDRRQPQSVTSHHGQGRLHGNPNGGEQGYDQVSGARYPQYWNDYTSFGQVGIMYTHPEGRHSSQPSHPPQIEMYLDGQYGNIYNNHPPP